MLYEHFSNRRKYLKHRFRQIIQNTVTNAKMYTNTCTNTFSFQKKCIGFNDFSIFPPIIFFYANNMNQLYVLNNFHHNENDRHFNCNKVFLLLQFVFDIL